ncbi:hypothetical protein M433DRAFT_132353 [Acidomyces richmondensis BFW]|nr:hypothetical protein M433DRAFT_132353 [Acidomyces richmondensis BFW]
MAHPLGFMGMDGGAGIASKPEQVVGTALAWKIEAPHLMSMAVLGDGDFLMGATAPWTAAKHWLPLLVVVANNSSFCNSQVHQERIAKYRGREIQNKWIEMKLDDLAPAVQKIAEGLGCTMVTSTQVRKKQRLFEIMKTAGLEVKYGKCVVVDVKFRPDGYSSALDKGKLTQCSNSIEFESCGMKCKKF